jgi:hypothetical protein
MRPSHKSRWTLRPSIQKPAPAAGYGSETIAGISFIFNWFFEIGRGERVRFRETANLKSGSSTQFLQDFELEVKPSVAADVSLRESRCVKELLK